MVAVAGGVGACGGSDDGTAAVDASVTVKTFAFQPSPLQVKAGTTVTWTNTDDILHTATSGVRGSADDVFDLRLDGSGATADVTFEQPGTFPYHCTIHPGMDGTVEVT
jgi:plastocyanin